MEGMSESSEHPKLSRRDFLKGVGATVASVTTGSEAEALADADKLEIQHRIREMLVETVSLFKKVIALKISDGEFKKAQLDTQKMLDEYCHKAESALQAKEPSQNYRDLANIFADQRSWAVKSNAVDALDYLEALMRTAPLALLATTFGPEWTNLHDKVKRTREEISAMK